MRLSPIHHAMARAMPVSGGCPVRRGERVQFAKSKSGWEEPLAVLRCWLHDPWFIANGYGGGPVHWRIEYSREHDTATTGIGAPRLCGYLGRVLPPLTTLPAPRVPPSGGRGRVSR